MPCRRGGRDERLLGAVQEPVRREEPALLGRVGVAEHHLLGVAAIPEVGAVGRVGEQAVEELGRARQRVGALEQRARRRGRAGPAGRSARAGTGRPNGSGSAARRASSSTAATSSGLVVNEITYRRQASTPNRAWSRAIARNVASTSPTRDARPATSTSGPGARPRAPRAPPDGRPRAGGPRATRGGTRTSRAASAARRPRPTRPGRARPSTSACWSDGQLRVERRGVRRSRRSAAPVSPVSAARVRRSRSAIAPSRCRYGSSGKRRRSWRIGLGQLLRVARERVVERPVDALGRDARGDGLHQPRARPPRSRGAGGRPGAAPRGA